MIGTMPGSVIIKGDWKLHHYFEDNDLELNNLSEEKKEKILELFNDLKTWRNKRKAPVPNKLNPDYDKKFVDSLLILIKNKNHEN